MSFTLKPPRFPKAYGSLGSWASIWSSSALFCSRKISTELKEFLNFFSFSFVCNFAQNIPILPCCPLSPDQPCQWHIVFNFGVINSTVYPTPLFFYSILRWSLSYIYQYKPITIQYLSHRNFTKKQSNSIALWLDPTFLYGFLPFIPVERERGCGSIARAFFFFFFVFFFLFLFQNPARNIPK